MEFLKENRNLVILIALLVIAYLLWDVEVVRNVRMTVVNQWNNMGMVVKALVVLVLLYLVYAWWSRE